MKKTTIFLAILLLYVVSFPISGLAQKSNFVKNPPMGWNSWYYFGKKDINEKIVRETIDAMVKYGLKDAGYVYVVIDGGWRDSKTGPNGELIPHPVKFPNGIKVLADYAHSKGMKLGLHTVPGTHDCGGDPVGGFNREEVHIRQFVEWGIDFIKLDLCTQKSDPCTGCEKSNRGWSEQTIQETYTLWNRLLGKCGREILYNISAYEFRDWYPEVCVMARTTDDILGRIHSGGALFNRTNQKKTGFLTVMEVALINNKSADRMGNGYFNDPDVLVVGEQGLTVEEQKSHFALWCMMSSPLILSNDPRNMSPAEKNLITNTGMIEINQDPTEQGRLIKSGNNTQVWAKKLKNEKVAVLLLNLDPAQNQEVSVSLSELGLKGKVKVRDVVNHKNLGKLRDRITLPAQTNQCWFLLLD